MKYIRIDIKTSRAGIEPLLAALLEVGITDAVVEDPADIDDLLDKKNDYDWDDVDESVLALRNKQPQVTVYMNDDDEGRAASENLKHAVDGLKSRAASGLFGKEADLGPLSVEMALCDDSGWKDKWKEYFKPAKVGKTIVVKPTWEEYECQPGEKVLEIDPGMAFGTGTHETTSLCIKLMEEYMKPGDKVLVIDNGIYGKGFADFVTMYGGKVEFYTAPYTKAIDVEAFGKYLEKNHDFRAMAGFSRSSHSRNSSKF